MKRALSLTLVAGFMYCCAAAAAVAQEPAAAARPSLALQAAFGRQEAPSLHPVPGRGVVTTWHTSFPRTPGWKEPEGALPLLAVRLAYNMEGEHVRVRVTVHRGVKFYDVEEFAAEYKAAEGESHVVGALSKFGIEPLRFSVVKRAPVAAAPLTTSYLTSSLEAVSAVVDDKISAVRLVLRNRSPKPVMALKLEATRGGAAFSTMWPLGREGRPLIEAGGVGEVRLGYGGGGGLKTEEGYAPFGPDGVVVASALFADGSYEGEVQPAAQAAALYEGYRLGLTRTLDLIRQAAGSQDVDDPEAAARFIRRVAELSRDADQPAVERVLGAYPELPAGEREGIRSAVETSISWLRQDVLAQLAPLGRGGAAGGLTFRGWLASREKAFDEWLARLSR